MTAMRLFWVATKTFAPSCEIARFRLQPLIRGITVVVPSETRTFVTFRESLVTYAYFPSGVTEEGRRAPEPNTAPCSSVSSRDAGALPSTG